MRILSKSNSHQFILIFTVSFFFLVVGCSHLQTTAPSGQKIAEPGKWFNFEGVNIHYTDCGSGQPMVLLHGFAASSYSWRHIIGNFCGRYKLFAIDLKGFGLSDKPRDERYSVEEQSKIVLSFMKEHDLRDITLVGHSFGGAVALFTYIQMQQSKDMRIARMVLIDSASYKQELPYFIKILRVPLLNILSLVLMPDRVSTRMILERAFYDDVKVTDDMVKTYADYLARPGAYHALIATSKQIIPSNINEVISHYREADVPALLIWGDMDEIVPVSIGFRLSATMPDAKLELVKNCGHVPQEECPNETIILFEEFLSEQDK